MARRSWFAKPDSKLTKTEQAKRDAAYESFRDGNPLFGTTLQETAHLGWALALVVWWLREDAVQFPDSSGRCVVLEVCLDNRGFSICKPVDEEYNKTMKEIKAVLAKEAQNKKGLIN